MLNLKRKTKKDCFELASYASLIANTLELEVHAVCFNADNAEELSNYGVKKHITTKTKII
ncbi:MAG: hypothetical protein CM15mP129_00860 [Chloroflexota bacterium]|nr:MAG: hypothetical protein CM15mP129_00860 [Chloroflexota bacterium]